jgi:hypothetical protein
VSCVYTYIFLCPILILNVHFSCLESYVKLHNWYAIHLFSSIGTQWNNNCEEKNWDHFNQFLLSFSFLDLKVNKFDITRGCPLRNQNDILDNHIPCKLTFVGVLNMEY